MAGVFLLLCMLAVDVSAHVPRESADNTSLDTAYPIEDPLKSWVFYDDIAHVEQVRYYSFTMTAGQRIRASVFTPDGGSFAPWLVVMGPTFDISGPVFPNVELPDSYGALVYEGFKRGAEYEPFTPGAYYYTAEADIVVSGNGTYYIAVASQDGTGPFGLALGYEERYMPIEWVRVATDAIRIRIWEGKSLIEIFYPYVVAGIVLFGLAWKKMREKTKTINAFMGITLIVAALYCGSGLAVLHHCLVSVALAGVGPTVVVTLIFAALPLVLGRAVYRLGWGRASTSVDRAVRVKLALYGGLGLVVWAGLIAGPLIALGGSMMPQGVLVTSSMS